MPESKSKRPGDDRHMDRLPKAPELPKGNPEKRSNKPGENDDLEFGLDPTDPQDNLPMSTR